MTYYPRLKDLNFNSHAHVERDGEVMAVSEAKKNFNSHAHVERDRYLRTVFVNQSISTHTLTWSVTF